MAEDGTKPTRPWQAIAADLAKEPDSERVITLAQELDRALALEQQSHKQEKVTSPPTSSM
jgi:hypothetical protein